MTSRPVADCVIHELCKAFTQLERRPPPPALGFRWPPESDYPPPTCEISGIGAGSQTRGFVSSVAGGGGR